MSRIYSSPQPASETPESKKPVNAIERWYDGFRRRLGIVLCVAGILVGIATLPVEWLLFGRGEIAKFWFKTLTSMTNLPKMG
jgi:hypothetical protein